MWPPAIPLSTSQAGTARWALPLLLSLLAACRAAAPSDMVYVPAGPYLMGVDRPTPDIESPLHQADLPAFWIDRLEVSNAAYGRCVAAGACSEPQDLRFFTNPAYADHPVVFVTWRQAAVYCRWAGKRLPTEAEWEKAARGPDGRAYPWGSRADPGRLNAGNWVGGTRPVGSYPRGASPYGALDMAGNVWEWVQDWLAPYPGGEASSPYFGRQVKVVRGGSWNHPVEDAHSYHRDFAHPDRALAVVGFRCARSPQP